jgi:hypothetical protein
MKKIYVYYEGNEVELDLIGESLMGYVGQTVIGEYLYTIVTNRYKEITQVFKQQMEPFSVDYPVQQWNCDGKSSSVDIDFEGLMYIDPISAN